MPGENKKKGSLAKIFTRAAYGTVIGTLALFAGYLALQNKKMEDLQDRANKTAPKTWTELVDRDSRPFKDPDIPTPERPAGQNTIVVQVESSYNETHALALDGPFFTPQDLLGKHGEAATAILKATADRLSDRDIETHFIESPESMTEWVLNENSLYMQRIWDKADVVSFSMNFVQLEGYGGGRLSTQEQIEKADKIWESSNTIFVWCAGNAGDKIEGVERREAAHTARADTLLRVGIGYVGDNGHVYIEKYSSRSGVSVITRNPFEDGFSYPYVKNEAELRESISRAFAYTPEMETRTISELFNAQVTGEYVRPMNLIDYFMAEYRKPYDPMMLQRCHPDFKNAIFPGKDILLRDPEWQKQHVEEVREAYINGLIDSISYHREKYDADNAGRVTGLGGTSFATPYAAGMIAAMHEAYPQLNDYDLVAAALIAAEPVYYVSGYKNLGRWLGYQNNGRGLLHNHEEGGFGFLDEEAYVETVKKMADLRKQRPELGTIQKWVHSALYPYGAQNQPVTEGVPGGMKDYKITIDEDIVALRANLMIAFAGGTDKAPETITLINPAGAAIEISPSRPLFAQGPYSLASTDGHFGNYTKGTWIVRVPQDCTVTSLKLSIPGMEKGGLVDVYLQKCEAEQDPARAVLAPLPMHQPAALQPAP